MLKAVANRKGYSFIEILFVMVLLSIFGITTYTLVAVGADCYQKMTDERNNNSNLRIALSYMSTRIRQGEVSGALQVKQAGDGDALVITQKIDGDNYYTWIYQNQGQLCELFISEDDDFYAESGFPIVDIGGMNIETKEGKGVTIQVWNNEEPDRRDVPLQVFLGIKSFE